MVSCLYPSMYVDIVSSSSFIIPGTYSDCNWLHLDSFLRVAGIDTNVVGAKDRLFKNGGTSICGRFIIASEGLVGAMDTAGCIEQERITLGWTGVGFKGKFFLARNLVILLTFRKTLAGLCLHMVRQVC